MRKQIKLTESDLKQIVKESVNKVLKENQSFDNFREIFKTEGLDSFHKLYDEYLPDIEEWDSAGNYIADFYSVMRGICFNYEKRGYSATALQIKRIMEKMDEVMTNFKTVRNYYEDDHFRLCNGGQSLDDYNYRKARWNADQGEVDQFSPY